MVLTAPRQMDNTDRIGTGVPGLDDVLGGGLPAHRLHLMAGTPGTGKTTTGLQFLLEGVRKGEPVLYVTLSETAAELQAVAESHGWTLNGVRVRELVPTEEQLRPDSQYTILHPSEMEFPETVWSVLEEVEKAKPARVVFDSLAELRLLANDPLRYRRQIMGLKQFFAGRRCTVLLLDNLGAEDNGVESLAHSVIHLEQLAPTYGVERRRLRTIKVRGARYRGGYHDFVIVRGGVVVFPRLVAAEHRETPVDGQVESDVPALDRLLNGGLDRGTSALLIGPAGVGKSVLASQYAVAMANRGEQAAIYIFDESASTYLRRSDSLQIPVRECVAAGRVTLEQLDPAQLSPGEFIHHVRRAVDTNRARLVVIDSLNGYLNAMAEERAVIIQLHELLSYLGQRGVLTILTMAQHGVVGADMRPPIDATYLADTVLLLRYFEAAGELRQAISVVKKRIGGHERAIRELRIGPGVIVGEPLTEFQGVLAGTPTYAGSTTSLLDARDGHGHAAD